MKKFLDPRMFMRICVHQGSRIMYMYICILMYIKRFPYPVTSVMVFSCSACSIKKKKTQRNQKKNPLKTKMAIIQVL